MCAYVCEQEHACTQAASQTFTSTTRSTTGTDLLLRLSVELEVDEDSDNVVNGCRSQRFRQLKHLELCGGTTVVEGGGKGGKGGESHEDADTDTGQYEGAGGRRRW